jgi:hypothetical protein
MKLKIHKRNDCNQRDSLNCEDFFQPLTVAESSAFKYEDTKPFVPVLAGAIVIRDGIEYVTAFTDFTSYNLPQSITQINTWLTRRMTRRAS